MATKKPQLYLSGDAEADRLLSRDPLALLIGLVLDQQVRREGLAPEQSGSPWDSRHQDYVMERLGAIRQFSTQAGCDQLRAFDLETTVHRARDGH